LQRGDLLTPVSLFRLPFCTLAVELGDLRTIGGKQFQAGNDAIFGWFTSYPAFGDGIFVRV